MKRLVAIFVSLLGKFAVYEVNTNRRRGGKVQDKCVSFGGFNITVQFIAREL
jgi:hypothetical protein